MRPVFALQLSVLTFLLGSVPTAVSASCEADEGLTRAAAALLEAERIDTEAIDRALVTGRSDQPYARARRAASTDGFRAWAARVSQRFDAPVACGRARDGERYVMLVAPRAASLTQRSSGRFALTLAEGFSDAYVVLDWDNREPVRRRVRAGEFRVEDADALVSVQVVARGESGPRPVARLAWGAAASAAETDIEDAEALREQVRRRRARRNAGELRNNRLLREVAVKHAEEVCREGRAAHRLNSGDPVRRLRREGVGARHVGEVAARGRNGGAAWSSLLRSSSHRLAIEDARFTDIGVGYAERDGHTCEVVLLAAWPRYLGRR